MHSLTYAHAHITKQSVSTRARFRSHVRRVVRRIALLISEEMLWRMIVFYILLSVHFPV
jgi:hypothetical protein